MFYSHEVLTSRRYGVATVWLVATLGSKSNLKKVSRKAILDVDVSKACETIVTPEAPMALRLQSNLLYGVSRVYQQQCGYVLSDAEAARNSMRTILKTFRQAELEDEGANMGRAEQLILPDDPDFLPDCDLIPVDQTEMQLLEDTIFLDTQHTLSSAHVSQSLSSSRRSIDSLRIPPSYSPSIGGPVGGTNLFGPRHSSGAQTRLEPFRPIDGDLGMMIDANGNILIGDQPVRQPHGPIERAKPEGLMSGRIRSDNSFQPAVGDTYMMLSGDEGVGSDPAAVVPPDPTTTATPGKVQHETSSECAYAAVRRRDRGRPKIIPLDTTTQLRNTDLARWAADYLGTMFAANKQKQASKLATLAKKNAEFWMLGSFLGQGMRGPLDMFTGAQLLEAFSSHSLLTQGEKRQREDNEGSDLERRVRHRIMVASDEVARRVQDDFDTQMIIDDTVEQGREAPTPLADLQLSSMFPWNQSAGSRQQSDTLGQRSVSLGQQPLLGRLSRQGSRHVSASPLLGRGAMVGNDSDYQPLGFDFAPDSVRDAEEFEIFGAAAHVDTQTANLSQWQHATLVGESANFRDFVQTAIEEADRAGGHAVAGDEDRGRLAGSIAFEALLPPVENTCIVAAQAMLHVLWLGTRNMLKVDQEKAFGPMTLRVINV